MRVVVDTNVVVSKFLSPLGSPAKIFTYLEQGRAELVISPALHAEYRSVLARPSLTKAHRMSEKDIEDALGGLLEDSIMVIPSMKLPGVTADPKDDMFVECAVAGGADFIVSGDRHLLELGSYDGITIVSPAVFVSLLESESPEE